MWAEIQRSLTAAKLAAVITKTIVQNALQDTGYHFTIHPKETAFGLTAANIKFGYDVGHSKRYGAVGDGVTDDTAAIQTAVNFCIYANFDLEIEGQSLLTASVNIDRQVDGAAFDNYFRIHAGYGGGFVVNTAIPMFSSSIAFTTAPVTQLVAFEGLAFISGNAANAAYVLNDARFLRTKFQGCSFDKIACLNAPTVYCQSIYFLGCQARRWQGVFFNSLAINYDIKFHSCLFEAGAQMAVLAAPVGSSCIGTTIEGMSGTAIRAYGGEGWTCTGSYFEGNDCDCDYRPLASESFYGIAHMGNYHSHTTGTSVYAVRWGNNFNAVSEANYCAGSLHELNAAAKVKINDYATVAVANVANYLSGAYNAPTLVVTAGTTAQGLVSNTLATANFSTVVIDTNGNFAGTRFTPTVPGYYRVSASMKFGATTITDAQVFLWKNGAQYQRLAEVPMTAPGTIGGSAIVKMNGTTDYLEIVVAATGTGLTLAAAATDDTSRFEADFLRP